MTEKLFGFIESAQFHHSCLWNSCFVMKVQQDFIRNPIKLPFHEKKHQVIKLLILTKNCLEARKEKENREKQCHRNQHNEMTNVSAVGVGNFMNFIHILKAAICEEHAGIFAKIDFAG